jgi:hypothetical protein
MQFHPHRTQIGKKPWGEFYRPPLRRPILMGKNSRR